MKKDFNLYTSIVVFIRKRDRSVFSLHENLTFCFILKHTNRRWQRINWRIIIIITSKKRKGKEKEKGGVPQFIGLLLPSILTQKNKNNTETTPFFFNLNVFFCRCWNVMFTVKSHWKFDFEKKRLFISCLVRSGNNLSHSSETWQKKTNSRRR